MWQIPAYSHSPINQSAIYIDSKSATQVDVIRNDINQVALQNAQHNHI